MRVDRLSRVLKRMVGEVLPILYDRLILKQLEGWKQTGVSIIATDPRFRERTS